MHSLPGVCKTEGASSVVTRKDRLKEYEIKGENTKEKTTLKKIVPAQVEGNRTLNQTDDKRQRTPLGHEILLTFSFITIWP